VNDETRAHGPGSGDSGKHLDVKLALINGVKALVLLLPVPDDAPTGIREGLVRRNIVNTGGQCPCGATATLPNRAQRRRGVTDIRVEHEDDCPAISSTLARELALWRATR
jgi:hypothetical protein